MANISRNPLVVVKNGTVFRLDTLAFSVSTKKGIAASMAPLRGGSPTLPGRNGTLYRASRKREENDVIISMWARDTDDNGVSGSDRYATWRSNMDKLLRLFDTQTGQIILREYVTTLATPGTALPSTGYREALVEVKGAIDPELKGRIYGEFRVVATINDTFWYDYQDTLFTSPTGATSVATHTLTGFAGATAPMEETIINIDGPITNPRVTDLTTGHYVQLNATVIAGQQWQVNSKLWRSVTGASLEFATTGGTSQSAVTVGVGKYSPRLFGLSASDTGPQVSLGGTSPSTSTRLRIQGRRKFH